MSARVIYTDRAVKDLRKLPRKQAQTVVTKIRFYSERREPLRYAKKLKAPFDDLYRFRIGNYRAVFEADAGGRILLLTILTIGDRKNVYE